MSETGSSDAPQRVRGPGQGPAQGPGQDRAQGPEQDRGRRASVPIGLGLALLSALLMVSALPGYTGFWPAAFVAVVPAIVAGYRFMPRRLSGLPLGIAWWGYWTAWGLLSSQISPLLPILVGGVVFGLVGVLVSAFDRRLSERTGYRWFLLQLPVTWTALDMIYGSNLIVGPEGQYAALVARAPFVLQPISLVGSIGLTCWLLLVNATVALAVLARLDRRRTPYDSVPVPARAARQVIATGVIVALAWLVAAGAILAQVRATQGPSVRVAAIQPGPGEGYDSAGDGAETPELMASLAAMTRQAKAEGAQFAVWAEHILTFDPRTDPQRRVQAAARENGIYLQVGWSVGPLPTATNVTGLWDPQGNLMGVYYKIHPVVMDNEDFVQPVRYPVFDTAFGPIGLIICFDASFEAPTRMLAAGGARLVSAAVGDWSRYAASRIPSMQLRAVENRVAYVKDELINASAVIDPTGSVVASAVQDPDGGRAVLVADVPLGPGGAPYTSLGPLVGYLCVLLLALRIILQARLGLRARRHPDHAVGES